MNVGYDPVAGEDFLHVEDGRSVFGARGDRLVAKHYQDEGILVCEMRGNEVEISYYPVEPPFPLFELIPIGQGRWSWRMT